MPPPMEQGMPPPSMGEMIRMMAEVRRKSQPIGIELVSQAIDLLDQAREADAKMAPRITMAIGLLERGPEAMDEMGGRGNPRGINPNDRKGAQ